MKGKFTVKSVAEISVLIALAMILSFAESQIPAFVAVPGVKVGLANLAVLITLYRFGFETAAAVSLIRVALVSLLFGNPVGWFYSFAGASLALLAMWGLKRLPWFTPIGVSILGGVAHNLGQIAAACVVMKTTAALAYLPILLLSGTVAGVVIGILGGILLNRYEKLFPR